MAFSNNTFPFMLLPAELRRGIYLYLVPNMPYDPVKSGGLYDEWDFDERFRYYDEICCPELLRTNREIYDEMLPLFYESTEFTIMVGDQSVKALNKSFASVNTLPPGFKKVKTLTLIILCEKYSPDFLSLVEGPVWRPDLAGLSRNLEAVASFFKSAQEGQLQEIDISVRAFRSLRSFFLGGITSISPEEREELKRNLRENLQLYLHPLRTTYNFHRVSVQQDPWESETVWKLHGFHPFWRVLSETTREYFNELERNLMDNKSGEVA
jgi:hypothetical protein